MRNINPTMTAGILSTDPLKARAKVRRWYKKRAEAGEYLSGVHKFELFHNQESVGEVRVMTGLEAKVLNDHYRKEFIDEINRVYPAHVAVPMKRWKVIEKFTKEVAA